MTAANKSSKYYFDQQAADRVVRFTERFIQHVQGEEAGTKFILEDWQKKEIIYPAFGWKNAQGHRKHRFIYVELPKGNGKSYLLSAISLYLALADGEYNAEIYCCAGDREQARIIFDTCRQMVEINPALRAACEVYKNSIVHKKTKSVIRVISAEAYSKHGYRPHGIAFDELHVQPNRELYDTLTRGMIKRKNSQCWMITTAGVKNTFAETLHDYALKVKNGIIKDDAWLPVIYAAKEKDDPFSEKTWLESNPGLGSIIDLDNFRVLAREAQNQPSALNNFKRLHLNLWTGSTEAWIPPHVWAKCNIQSLAPCRDFFDSEDYKRLNKLPCWAGLDLASTRDLSSFALLFEIAPDEKYELLVFVFCPEDTIYDRTLKENINYQAWADAGYLIATEGNIQDQEFIKSTIVRCWAELKMKRLGFDPWNADALATDLYNTHDIDVKKITQTLATLSEPSKFFEKIITSGKLNHGGNPLIAWMMDNVQIYRDTNDNYRPHKGKSKGKIDGIMAAITAVATMMDWKASNDTFDANSAISWIN